MSPGLSFRSLSVTSEHGTLRDLDVEWAEPRVCLLGNWQPLFCLLAGRAEPRSGELLFDGQPARKAAMEGQLGLADPKLRLPSAETVHDWLVDNLLLAGSSRRAAGAGAEQALDALQVRFLQRRACHSLSAAEVYAARLALAMSTRPKAVLAMAPVALAETASFELSLLRRVADRVSLVAISDWFSDAGTIGWSQRVVSVSQGKITSNCAMPAWLRERSCYCLVTSSNQRQLELELERSGFGVINPGQRELLVALPSGQSTRPLVAAAHRAAAPLIRLLPLDDAQAARAPAAAG